MPLLNHTNVRAQEASEAAVVGTMNNGIGNTTHGQGVYLTGAEQPIDVETGVLAYHDHESITVSSTALSLTAAKADNYTSAYITTETDAVRFWLDGQAPTASVGHSVAAGGQIILTGRAELDGFRVIRVTNDATLRVSYANRAV